MAGGGSKLAVLAALAANFLISILKLGAGLFTGSASMLAEAAHSASDTGNQILLLVGMKTSRKPANEKHQFGYGREAFFWPFMVALLLFTVAGAYSFYHGLEKILHPEPIKDILVAFAVLGISILIEVGSLWVALKAAFQQAKASGARSTREFLDENKDAALLTIIIEDGLALAGLVLATLFLGIAYFTGNTVWDGVGSLTIGAVLMGFAAFLAVEIRSLLLGEAMSKREEARLRAFLAGRREIASVVAVKSMHLGPDEVLLALELDFPDELSSNALEHQVIPDLEAALLKEFPRVTYLFIESVATSAAVGVSRHQEAAS